MWSPLTSSCTTSSGSSWHLLSFNRRWGHSKPSVGSNSVVAASRIARIPAKMKHSYFLCHFIIFSLAKSQKAYQLSIYILFPLKEKTSHRRVIKPRAGSQHIQLPKINKQTAALYNYNTIYSNITTIVSFPNEETLLS